MYVGCTTGYILCQSVEMFTNVTAHTIFNDKTGKTYISGITLAGTVLRFQPLFMYCVYYTTNSDILHSTDVQTNTFSLLNGF